MRTKTARSCTTPGCRSNRKGEELCGYHETLKNWGPKWARLAYPNHPEAGRAQDET